MSLNENIIEQFKLLAKQIKLDIDYSSGKEQMVHMFRLKSIMTVIKILTKYTDKITSSIQLKGISGIGKGTLERIDEILKTGKLSEVKLTSLDEQYIRYLDELEDVFGIGRKKAYELFTIHGVKSVDELKTKYENGEIKLPDNIAKGLKYVGLIKENIPREEIDEVNLYLMKTILSLDNKLFGLICGSYRRLQLTSNDVDIIIVHSDVITKNDAKSSPNYLNKLINRMKNDKFIIDSLTSEDVPTKYMGIFKWKDNPHRRIDIRFIPYESYYSATLYFTGGKDFNRKMRQVAVNNGYVLNEYGLFDEKDNMILVSSEKDIFDELGMEYVTPDKRI